MTTPLLIHADSLRDADMFVATGVSVVDPFTYLEVDGRRIIVASVLEAEVIERDSRATEIWRDDDFGGRRAGSELASRGRISCRVHGAERHAVARDASASNPVFGFGAWAVRG